MKTKIISIFALILSLFSFSFAGELAGFVISIDPSTIKVGEPADVTIKAIDENGDTVTDYQGDIIMSLVDKEGNELDDADYTLPNDGNYSFTEEDQGEKKFTKGFIVNKAGDYNLIIEDFETEQSGKGEVKVINKDAGAQAGKVTIDTPQDGETIVSSTMTIVGSAPNYRNSKIELLVDDVKKEEGQVDESGNYQIDLQGLSDGDHTLQVNVLDIDDKVVASSKKITVTLSVSNDLLKNVEILPSEVVDQGTKVQVNVEVAPSVTSVIMKIANYGEYPMDRVSTDKFTAQFVANTAGVFDVSFELKGEFGSKKYDNYKQLTVKEKIAIKNVRFVRDNPKKTIDLKWEFTGQVPSFKVLYSTEKEKVDNDLTAIVSENKYTIENIDEGKTYFVKIVPTDSDGNKIGEESKLLVIEPDMKQAATCTIDNIKLNVAIEGDKHYLVWEAATGAIEYAIYKGDKEDKLIKISTTTGTTYEIPFNKNAKKDEYAYYSVKAVCDDGNEKQIDKVKKVKVGPLDWIIYALIIAMMIYGIKLSYKNA